MSFLYSAEPCTAPEPCCVHIKRGDAVLGRLSAREAIALARDILAAALPAEKDPR